MRAIYAQHGHYKIPKKYFFNGKFYHPMIQFLYSHIFTQDSSFILNCMYVSVCVCVCVCVRKLRPYSKNNSVSLKMSTRGAFPLSLSIQISSYIVFSITIEP